MRVLYVAMAPSIHVARFLSQVNHLGWDLHLFNSTPEWGPGHSSLRNVTLHGCRYWQRPTDMDPSVRLQGYWPFPRGYGMANLFVKRVLQRNDGSARGLARVIKKVRPDVIHSHEIQHSGYLIMDSLRHLDRPLPPWIVTNWGNDIYYFGRLQKHEPLIRAVLGKCDYYTCECERDVHLGRKFGFAGEILQPVMPNPGGFRFEELDPLRSPGPVSARRIILMKGYQGIFGRAMTGLVALEMCKDLLRDYQILVYSATSEEVLNGVEMLARSTGLDIKVVPHTEDYNAMMRLRGQARISIGLSVSDAASISFLEALAMGSFPVQSNGGCTCEWVRDGEGGFIVQPEDPYSIADALRKALTDDALVNRAAEINYTVARDRLDYYKLREKVIGWYQTIQARGKK